MTINLENCKANRQNLGYHPKFWDKPEAEIIGRLEDDYTRSLNTIEHYSEKTDLDRMERAALESAQQFVKIAKPVKTLEGNITETKIKTPRGNITLVTMTRYEMEAIGFYLWFEHEDYYMVGDGNRAFAVAKTA